MNKEDEELLRAAYQVMVVDLPHLTAQVRGFVIKLNSFAAFATVAAGRLDKTLLKQRPFVTEVPSLLQAEDASPAEGPVQTGGLVAEGQSVSPPGDLDADWSPLVVFGLLPSVETPVVPSSPTTPPTSPISSPLSHTVSITPPNTPEVPPLELTPAPRRPLLSSSDRGSILRKRSAQSLGIHLPEVPQKLVTHDPEIEHLGYTLEF